MSTTPLRVPAGSPAGGRFAAHSRAEASVALPYRGSTLAERPEATARINAAVMAAWPFDPGEAGLRMPLTPRQARDAVRACLAGLAEDRLAAHWARIEQAARQASQAASLPYAASLEDMDPELTEPVGSPADYTTWNEPDRPGEDGYPGFDAEEFRQSVVDYWDAQLGDAMLAGHQRERPDWHGLAMSTASRAAHEGDTDTRIANDRVIVNGLVSLADAVVVGDSSLAMSLLSVRRLLPHLDPETRLREWEDLLELSAAELPRLEEAAWLLVVRDQVEGNHGVERAPGEARAARRTPGGRGQPR